VTIFLNRGSVSELIIFSLDQFLSEEWRIFSNCTINVNLLFKDDNDVDQDVL